MPNTRAELDRIELKKLKELYTEKTGRSPVGVSKAKMVDAIIAIQTEDPGDSFPEPEAAPEEDTGIFDQPEVFEFITRHDNLTIVVKSRRKRIIDDEIIYTDGESIQFKNGIFKTTDPATAEYLRKNDMRKRNVYQEVVTKVGPDLAKQVQELKKNIGDEQDKNRRLQAEIDRLAKLQQGQAETAKDAPEGAPEAEETPAFN